MAKVMDHVTYDLNVYMSQQQDDTPQAQLDSTGWPMQYGESYWKVDGKYVPTDNADLLHDFLVREGEDYGTPIDWNYDNLAAILENYKDAEVISWT